MYILLFYPNSYFQNFEECIKDIFDKHDIQISFCYPKECCLSFPCKKGKFYNVYKEFDEIKEINKQNGNMKYVIFYQKNILQKIENDYFQMNDEEKNGLYFLKWIQQNKNEYQYFCENFINETNTSSFLFEYSEYEKSQLSLLYQLISFLEPNFIFDKNIIYQSLKKYEQNHTTFPNYQLLYSQFISIQSNETILKEIVENYITETNLNEIVENENI